MKSAVNLPFFEEKIDPFLVEGIGELGDEHLMLPLARSAVQGLSNVTVDGVRYAD